MPEFDQPNAKIHVISRGLIIQGDTVLLCKLVGESWYFLPGGHVENGETAKQALLRELEEEIGFAECIIGDFLGLCENTFKQSENSLQQEINVIFGVQVPDDFVIESREKHIEFVTIPKFDVSEYKILPNGIKSGIVEWMKTGRVFYK